MKVTIIYPVEPSYIFGLVSGLCKNNITIDLIGSDRITPIVGKYKNVKIFNLRGSQITNVNLYKKFFRVIKFYTSLVLYMIKTDSKIVHIHWLDRFFIFDSTLLILFYKILNKKVLYTAHNIDRGLRDDKFGKYKNIAYRILYKIVDHIIVHNQFSFHVLQERFNVPDSKISMHKMGIITAPTKGIDKISARNSLNISMNKKILLFFGNIVSYKGLDLLIDAFSSLSRKDQDYFLLIAGQPLDYEYFQLIKDQIKINKLENNYLTVFDFIPYSDIEKYFVAADCIVLPYKYIFQSAVHTLSFFFGLPVLATDVGSFKIEDIIDGFNGFITSKVDSQSLENTIMKYFESELYKNLRYKRTEIKKWAEDNYSWDSIGNEVYSIYNMLLLNK